MRFLLCAHQSLDRRDKSERTHAALTQGHRHRRHSRDLQHAAVTSRGRAFYVAALYIERANQPQAMGKFLQYVAEVLELRVTPPRLNTSRAHFH